MQKYNVAGNKYIYRVKDESISLLVSQTVDLLGARALESLKASRQAGLPCWLLCVTLEDYDPDVPPKHMCLLHLPETNRLFLVTLNLDKIAFQGAGSVFVCRLLKTTQGLFCGLVITDTLMYGGQTWQNVDLKTRQLFAWYMWTSSHKTSPLELIVC